MGFSSYTCAKTNLPVMASTSWGHHPEMCEVVALINDGSSVSGLYDGYGQIDGQEPKGINLWDGIRQGIIKLVLKKFYQGETFDQLGCSHDDPGQGHFHNEDFLVQAFAKGGFASYEEFVSAMNSIPDSVLFGNIGDIWNVSLQRLPATGESETIPLQVVVSPDIIFCGGDSLPGVVMVDDEQSAKLSDFEREWVCYVMNEGGELSAQTEPDEEGGDVWKFQATRAATTK